MGNGKDESICFIVAADLDAWKITRLRRKAFSGEQSALSQKADVHYF
jgi:hypothetical protein